MKNCIKCSIEKEIEFFPKQGNICKECKSIYIKEYYQKNKNDILQNEKKRYQENREDRIEKQLLYASIKKEEKSIYLKKYRKDNKDSLHEKRKNYNKEKKEKINETRRNRYKERIKNDLNFKLSKIHRNILKRILRYKKHESTSDLLGYASIELKENIESKFKYGMSWDNYGEWEIDHIIPVSSFDLEKTSPSIVNSLDNLQPLWKIENIKKSNHV
jgi:hypothetical protein